MEAQSIEDMMPNTLRITLKTLLKENVLINYKIFGGEMTVISLKFGIHVEGPTAEPTMHGNHNKPYQPQMQSFKRKSPGSIERDIRRLDMWKSRPYDTPGPFVNNIDRERNTHGNGLDISYSGSYCDVSKQSMNFGCDRHHKFNHGNKQRCFCTIRC